LQLSHKAFAAAVALVVLASNCSADLTGSDLTPPGTDPATTTYASSLGINISAMTKLSSSLYIQDLVPGTGASGASGDSVIITYTGWLVDGTQFQSNLGKQPFGFRLGAGLVIKGWDQGIVGMRVGGTRRLVVGSSLGYGTAGYPLQAVPSNSTLVFAIQLTAVQ
jgi:FKBP-type peptidyl-prolyl cis-trans isomerase